MAWSWLIHSRALAPASAWVGSGSVQAKVSSVCEPISGPPFFVGLSVIGVSSNSSGAANGMRLVLGRLVLILLRWPDQAGTGRPQDVTGAIRDRRRWTTARRVDRPGSARDRRRGARH